MMALHIRAAKLPVPKREHLFHVKRKWRFDFCWPEKRLAVEIDGGNSMAAIVKGRAVAVGRHTKPDDYRKMNEAAIMGFTVLRFTPAMVKSGEAINTLELLLRGME